MIKSRVCMPAKAGIHLFFWIPAFAGMLLVVEGALAQVVVEDTPPECRLLTEHAPQSDVTYQGGFDVNGKAVVPADLNAAPVPVPDKIIVPLTIDLAQRLQNNNVQGLNMDATLGFLEFERNGRVLYNGRDLTNQVYALCGQKSGVSAPTTDGQTPDDALKSDAYTLEDADEQPSAKKQ